MTIEVNTVKISETSLEGYKTALQGLNPDFDRLHVEIIPIGVNGMEFSYNGQLFTVTGSDIESNEEPLLAAMLKGFEQYEEEIEDEEVDRGYYTVDGRPADNFPTEFVSHSEYRFSAGERYAKNVPGVQEDTLIGFYWIPLSGIMNFLQLPYNDEVGK